MSEWKHRPKHGNVGLDRFQPTHRSGFITRPKKKKSKYGRSLVRRSWGFGK